MRHIVLIFCLLTFCACQPNALETNTSTGGATEADIAQPDSVGEGTAVAPYTVAQVQQGVSRTADVWVAGYVVGYCDGTINKCNFTANGAVLTNILLAASPKASFKEEVLTVQLSGKNIQRDLALCYDASRLGRAVMLHVEVITKYLSALGLYGIDQHLWLTNPDALNLAYGGGSSSGGSSSDDGKEVDVETEEDGKAQFLGGTGDDVFSIYGIDYFGDVIGTNPRHNGNEGEPFYPDYVFSHTALHDGWKKGVWVLGYVTSWTADGAGVVLASAPDATTKTLTADMDTEAMKAWMAKTFTIDKTNRPLRIYGYLKYGSDKAFHLVDIENMDWLTPKK
ncbi:MAG: hypothetical protein HUK00_00525 [Bacteroidaceae bacterium]|nr:hypothetical protein [Bacteroidaceae bacterium]